MSQSTEVNTINYITNQLYIYGYGLIIITGLFGNTLNIILFSTRFKESVCSFYLLVSDVFNTVAILFYNLMTVIQLVYGKDGSESSLPWCRILCFTGDLCLLYVPCTLCLASIDRYLCSSREVSLRQWSSMKVAKISLVVSLIVSSCFLIPDLIDWYIDTDNNTCAAGETYYEYMSYFLYPVMVGFVPLIILSVFGYKTYQNLRTSIRATHSTTRQFRRRRIDNQLARLFLIQIPYFFFQTVIFVAIYLYITITLYWKKNDMRVAVENLIEAIGFIIYDTSTCINFYIYYTQSVTFRAAVKKLLMRKRVGNIGRTFAITN